MSEITKYTVKWQLTRVRVKGKKIDIDDKIEIVKKFFFENRSQENLVRVMNWAEGLIKGYMASGDLEKIEKIKEAIASINNQEYRSDGTAKYIESLVYLDLCSVSHGDKQLLLQDLFQRNKKWCEKGYVHDETVSFIRMIYKAMKIKREEPAPGCMQEAFENIVSKGHQTPNTYKFLF
jgi:hypothetical protein